ncbi:galactose-1-phosphate uridylyltransferase [Corynebacterium otitidis]|uniref:Galactose-1-phosphate uridylyltransferase n=1 Tax=Corynebacterium otitidis ATCC 51513 TaxID=883169 RepID=I7KJI9_9CORY|nr:galactose-1-phosphate uridylyltransferase [Corynebacterium otitidis]EJZ81963.1 galactose-1-phosphate uridylyltransferase [Corynebacterium otitidis ATCC 51513]CCI83640.1 galactose-1-phosphate uridylyltransferase [Corynebacterium otitidis ATCC 51513]
MLEETYEGLRITRGRLADDREIIYVDRDPDAPPRTAPDPRELPEQRPASELRRDPLTGEWRVFAAHRQDRTFLPPASDDPLSPARPGAKPSEVPADDYDILVFENRFPSLSTRAEISDGAELGLGPLVERAAALGRCEVVSYTPDPEGSFKDLPREKVRALIDVWAHRTAELAAIPGVRAVFPFENRGEEIGVTLSHPHGQIYAYPFVPPRLARLSERAAEHEAATGRDLFADVLAAELDAGRRVLTETEHFVAYVPAAAAWPLEAIVMPRRAVSSFPGLTAGERDDLAGLLPDLFAAVDRFFPGIEATPYIAAWNQAPDPAAGEGPVRLHLQLFSLMRSPGRMKYLAGSESAMGAWISDTTPETIADRLREVWPC